MPHGTDSAGGQEPQSSGPPHMGRLRGRRPRSQGRCEELRRGIRREGRALRPTWDVIARAEGQEPQRSTSQGRRPGALGARTNCATWHRFGRRPGATEQRTAPHGAVEGPEAQEPEELASERCGGTYIRSEEAQAISRPPFGVRSWTGRRPGATTTCNQCKLLFGQALCESGPKARSFRSKDKLCHMARIRPEARSLRSKGKLCHMAQVRPEARSHRAAERPTRGGRGAGGPGAKQDAKSCAAA